MTLKIKKIALFAPNSSALYVNVLLGLKKEFVKRGVDAHVGWSYLHPALMEQFCSVYKPDAILEIDRTRDNALGIPDSVISIAWIQDWRSMGHHHVGYSSDNCGGSDLYYFCAKPISLGVDVTKLPHWDYLLQATDPEIYFPVPMVMECNFSLVGYIPPKEHLYKLNQFLEVELEVGPVFPGEFGTIGQLIEVLQSAGLTWNRYDALEARRVVNRYIYFLLSKREGFPEKYPEQQKLFESSLQNLRQCVVADKVMYLVENEIMRALARISVVNNVLSVSDSLHLFGIGMWQTYPEFLSYYRGPVNSEDEVRRIYLTSRINLHNAMTQMHTRVLDCMATGSVIMVNKVLHNTSTDPDSLKAHFEPGLHYFEYDDDDLAERSRELLADVEGRKRAGFAAREAICSRHTWAHRVDQILKDLAHL